MRLPALLFVLLAAAPAAAQTSSIDLTAPPYPLAGWAELKPADRQSTIVAATEGLLLAATGPIATAPKVDQDCLSMVSPTDVERKLLAIAASDRRISFLDAYLGVTKCSKH